HPPSPSSPTRRSSDLGGSVAAPAARRLSTVELTTVSDDEAVFFDGVTVHRLEGLEPDTEHAFAGQTFRTLPRPAGERLATIATVDRKSTRLNSSHLVI